MKNRLFYRRKRTVGLYAVTAPTGHFFAFDIVPMEILVMCRLKKTAGSGQTNSP